MSTLSDTVILDVDTADFITHHVAMVVASANVQNIPSLARAYGCSVATDRAAVNVMLMADHCQTLLTDLRNTGQIAIVATNPSTHKTIQLKGKLDSIAPLQATDRLCMQAFMDTFSEDIKLLGYDEDYAIAFRPDLTAAGVRVSFNPSAIFVSTPGPQAGIPLKTSL